VKATLGVEEQPRQHGERDGGEVSSSFHERRVRARRRVCGLLSERVISSGSSGINHTADLWTVLVPGVEPAIKKGIKVVNIDQSWARNYSSDQN